MLLQLIQVFPTVVDVLNRIKHSKNKKCDGYGLVYSDHFIHAPQELRVFISGVHVNGVSRACLGCF